MLSGDYQSKQNKLLSDISLFVCVVLIIGVLFSSFFIAEEHNHHCHGENCPICQMVAICESFLDNVGAGTFIYAAVVFTTLFVYTTGLLSKYVFKAPTLVSQKVRLND